MGIDLLGVEEQRARVREQLLAQRPGPIELPELCQGGDQPERADRERSLLAAEAVLGFLDPVPQHQLVLGELVGDGQDGRADPVIAGRQEADERDQRQRGVQRRGLVMLAEHPAVVGAVGAHVGVDLGGRLPPARRQLGFAAQHRELRAAVSGHPAHDLGGGEMPGRAADLPHPLIGLAPVRESRFHLPLEHRPAALVQPVPGTAVQVGRVEQDPPHILLALVPGAVADPDRPGPVVARQVVEDLLGELALAADPVHDLQVLLLSRHVRQEVEEVVGFPVQAQRVQAPQHERGIAEPGVPVVIGAVPAGRLRQGAGRGRQQRPGGRVDQALQRQRRPQQVLAPRVIGEVAAAEPFVPEVAGCGQPVVRLAERLRRGRIAPGQGAEHLLSGPQPAARDRPRALEPEIQVGGQPDLRRAAQPASACP